jgi:hypothetical protein
VRRSVNAEEITARLENLHGLLQQDSARVNIVFRQILGPIPMTPMEGMESASIARVEWREAARVSAAIASSLLVSCLLPDAN